MIMSNLGIVSPLCQLQQSQNAFFERQSSLSLFDLLSRCHDCLFPCLAALPAHEKRPRARAAKIMGNLLMQNYNNNA